MSPRITFSQEVYDGFRRRLCGSAGGVPGANQVQQWGGRSSGADTAGFQSQLRQAGEAFASHVTATLSGLAGHEDKIRAATQELYEFHMLTADQVDALLRALDEVDTARAVGAAAGSASSGSASSGSRSSGSVSSGSVASRTGVTSAPTASQNSSM